MSKWINYPNASIFDPMDVMDFNKIITGDTGPDDEINDFTNPTITNDVNESIDEGPYKPNKEEASGWGMFALSLSPGHFFKYINRENWQEKLRKYDGVSRHLYGGREDFPQDTGSLAVPLNQFFNPDVDGDAKWMTVMAPIIRSSFLNIGLGSKKFGTQVFPGVGFDPLGPGRWTEKGDYNLWGRVDKPYDSEFNEIIEDTATIAGAWHGGRFTHQWLSERFDVRNIGPAMRKPWMRMAHKFNQSGSIKQFLSQVDTGLLGMANRNAIKKQFEKINKTQSYLPADHPAKPPGTVRGELIPAHRTKNVPGMSHHPELSTPESRAVLKQAADQARQRIAATAARSQTAAYEKFVDIFDNKKLTKLISGSTLPDGKKVRKGTVIRSYMEQALANNPEALMKFKNMIKMPGGLMTDDQIMKVFKPGGKLNWDRINKSLLDFDRLDGWDTSKPIQNILKTTKKDFRLKENQGFLDTLRGTAPLKGHKEGGTFATEKIGQKINQTKPIDLAIHKETGDFLDQRAFKLAQKYKKQAGQVEDLMRKLGNNELTPDQAYEQLKELLPDIKKKGLGNLFGKHTKEWLTVQGEAFMKKLKKDPKGTLKLVAKGGLKMVDLVPEAIAAAGLWGAGYQTMDYIDEEWGDLTLRELIEGGVLDPMMSRAAEGGAVPEFFASMFTPFGYTPEEPGVGALARRQRLIDEANETSHQAIQQLTQEMMKGE